MRSENGLAAYFFPSVTLILDGDDAVGGVGESGNCGSDDCDDFRSDVLSAGGRDRHCLAGGGLCRERYD